MDPTASFRSLRLHRRGAPFRCHRLVRRSGGAKRIRPRDGSQASMAPMLGDPDRRSGYGSSMRDHLPAHSRPQRDPLSQGLLGPQLPPSSRVAQCPPPQFQPTGAVHGFPPAGDSRTSGTARGAAAGGERAVRHGGSGPGHGGRQRGRFSSAEVPFRRRKNLDVLAGHGAGTDGYRGGLSGRLGHEVAWAGRSSCGRSRAAGVGARDLPVHPLSDNSFPRTSATKSVISRPTTDRGTC